MSPRLTWVMSYDVHVLIMFPFRVLQMIKQGQSDYISRSSLAPPPCPNMVTSASQKTKMATATRLKSRLDCHWSCSLSSPAASPSRPTPWPPVRSLRWPSTPHLVPPVEPTTACGSIWLARRGRLHPSAWTRATIISCLDRWVSSGFTQTEPLETS